MLPRQADRRSSFRQTDCRIDERFLQRPPCAITRSSTFRRTSQASAGARLCKARFARSSIWLCVVPSRRSASSLTSASTAAPGCRSPADPAFSRGMRLAPPRPKGERSIPTSSSASGACVRMVACGNMACSVDAIEPAGIAVVDDPSRSSGDVRSARALFPTRRFRGGSSKRRPLRRLIFASRLEAGTHGCSNEAPSQASSRGMA
mmetsp:Transcript_6690/g.20816  ORF Transcript_6690/g.20816 Transcript_6690/m.20816 type:complete len:205 (-) Transcript_6690:490-1104(-)